MVRNLMSDEVARILFAFAVTAAVAAAAYYGMTWIMKVH
jgi:hypothetical protein